jgi:hypothetical protein
MKYLVCYLEENYGVSLYDSKEEFIENFAYMFGEDLTFEELLIEMDEIYEVIEVKGDVELKWLIRANHI